MITLWKRAVLFRGSYVGGNDLVPWMVALVRVTRGVSRHFWEAAGRRESGHWLAATRHRLAARAILGRVYTVYTGDTYINTNINITISTTKDSTGTTWADGLSCQVCCCYYTKLLYSYFGQLNQPNTVTSYFCGSFAEQTTARNVFCLTHVLAAIKAAFGVSCMTC